MKKEFKLVSASIVGIVCASLMTPSFAASSVRSLGGAGTYTGTTSATQAASATKASTTAARAGSIRVDSSTRVNSGSSLRTPSTRSATAPRLSIGKYLSTNSSLGTGGKTELSNTVNSSVNELNTRYDELEQTVKEFNIDGLRSDIASLAGAEVELSYNPETGDLTIIHGDHTSTESILNEAAVDAMIAAAIADALENYIPESEKYEAGDMIDITNNKVSAKIVGALTGALDQEEGLVTANQTIEYVTGYVGGYAIPKPQAACGHTTCVLSVQEGTPYWLELVNAEPVSDDLEQQNEIVTE